MLVFNALSSLPELINVVMFVLLSSQSELVNGLVFLLYFLVCQS